MLTAGEIPAISSHDRPIAARLERAGFSANVHGSKVLTDLPGDRRRGNTAATSIALQIVQIVRESPSN
jgi:hypothetical protein